MVQKTGSMPALDTHEEHEHPGLGTYVRVAVFLAIVTAVEVAIYYLPAFGSILVEALIILSAVKFLFVVGYFMHLKMDPRLLAGIFGSALIVALSVYVAVGIMQRSHEINIFFGGK